jgi:hypothetical protein
MMALQEEQYCKASTLQITLHLTFLIFSTKKTCKTKMKSYMYSQFVKVNIINIISLPSSYNKTFKSQMTTDSQKNFYFSMSTSSNPKNWKWPTISKQPNSLSIIKLILKTLKHYLEQLKIGLPMHNQQS